MITARKSRSTTAYSCGEVLGQRCKCLQPTRRVVGVEQGADERGADDDGIGVRRDLSRLVTVGDTEPDPDGQLGEPAGGPAEGGGGLGGGGARAGHTPPGRRGGETPAPGRGGGGPPRGAGGPRPE